MEIRIGIINSPRELSFESADTAADLQKRVAEAIESKSSHLALKGDDGRLYIVPTASLAYVEVGTEKTRRVGFVA